MKITLANVCSFGSNSPGSISHSRIESGVVSERTNKNIKQKHQMEFTFLMSSERFSFRYNRLVCIGLHANYDQNWNKAISIVTSFTTYFKVWYEANEKRKKQKRQHRHRHIVKVRYFRQISLGCGAILVLLLFSLQAFNFPSLLIMQYGGVSISNEKSVQKRKQLSNCFCKSFIAMKWIFFSFYRSNIASDCLFSGFAYKPTSASATWLQRMWNAQIFKKINATFCVQQFHFCVFQTIPTAVCCCNQKVNAGRKKNRLISYALHCIAYKAIEQTTPKQQKSKIQNAFMHSDCEVQYRNITFTQTLDSACKWIKWK